MKVWVLKAVMGTFLYLGACAPNGRQWSPPPEFQNVSEPVLQEVRFLYGYKEDVMPILDENCSGCHSAGLLNWKDFKNFSGRLDALEIRVLNKRDMPPFPALPDSQLEIIRHWILDKGPFSRDSFLMEDLTQ
jgi:hypothetical protein